jgi:RNA polymerase sigma-70 factor (ECF subfamily)
MVKQLPHWPTTHAGLLAKIQDRQDNLAWREFVDLYSPLILAYCRKRGLQYADAQDVTQNILTAISRAIRTFDYDISRGRFRGWLGLIADQQLSRFFQGSLRQRRGVGAPNEPSAAGLDGAVDAAWEDLFNAHVYQAARARVRVEFDFDTWLVFEKVWEQSVDPCDVARELKRKSQWIYQAKFKVVQRLVQEIDRLCDDMAIFSRRLLSNDLPPV